MQNIICTHSCWITGNSVNILVSLYCEYVLKYLELILILHVHKYRENSNRAN